MCAHTALSGIAVLKIHMHETSAIFGRPFLLISNPQVLLIKATYGISVKAIISPFCHINESSCSLSAHSKFPHSLACRSVRLLFDHDLHST